MTTTDLQNLPDVQRPCRQPSSRSTSQPTTPEPQGDVLDIKALAALLLVHRVTATMKAQAGEIPGRMVGNRWRFSRAAIMRWLETSA
jgi:excisionase family DNA binding protein